MGGDLDVTLETLVENAPELLSPPSEKDGRVSVSFAVFATTLLHVDLAKQDFKVEYYTRLDWKDDRIEKYKDMILCFCFKV